MAPDGENNAGEETCATWTFEDDGTKRGRKSLKTGGEKQLLVAILNAGGSITPVEAALKTSLTVDEAEQILTRFADRGHLLVQSRDGALLYVVPERGLTT